MKLLIGAGYRRLDGFVHQDRRMIEGVDIICDFWDLPLNVMVGSCEEIRVRQLFDQIEDGDLNKAVDLIRSLLSRDGKLYIENFSKE